MRTFMLLWVGQLVSLLGSGMTCFAQTVTVYTDLGGTITHLMLLAAAAQMPGVLVSPFAGVLVDRWNRRWVMIISDTVAAMATLTLRILVVRDSFQLWQMYVLVVIISIANHFQWPAYFATISLMVPKGRLGYANGLVQVARSLSNVGAPFLAGLAVVVFKLEGVILFDMASYLFALAILLIIRIPQPSPADDRVGRAALAPSQVGLGEPDISMGMQPEKRRSGGIGAFMREALYGWSYLFKRPGLLGLLVLFAIANYTLANVYILFIPLALSFTSPTELGSVMSAGGISMLVGGLAMSAWGGPKRRIYGVLGFVALQGVAFMLMGTLPVVWLLFGAYLIYMFAMPFVNANSGAIWQSKVATSVQGRVLAASSMASTLALELGYVTSGPLADYVFEPLLATGGPLAGSIGRIIGTGEGRGVGFMFIVMGIVCASAALVGFLYPRVRRLDVELPDAIPGQDFATLQASGQSVKPALRQIDLMAD
jgi:MFS family permease